MSDSTLHFPNLWKNPLHPSLVVEPLREKEEGVSGSLQEAVQNNQSSPPPSASPATPPLSFLHTGKGPPPQGLCCPWFLLSFRFSPTSPVPNCFSDPPDLRESPPSSPTAAPLATTWNCFTYVFFSTLFISASQAPWEATKLATSERNTTVKSQHYTVRLLTGQTTVSNK